MGTARARILRRQLAVIVLAVSAITSLFNVLRVRATVGAAGRFFTSFTVNTAARLREYAKRTGFDLVVSGAVLARLTLPPGIEATPCGEVALRGKQASIAAYGLTGTPA